MMKAPTGFREVTNAEFFRAARELTNRRYFQDRVYGARYVHLFTGPGVHVGIGYHVDNRPTQFFLAVEG
jgi:hypothetical protein